MQNLVISHDDAARGAELHPADLRTLRRVLECPVPERRVSGTKKIHFDVELIVEWLRHVLPRLSPAQEHRILNLSRPAPGINS